MVNLAFWGSPQTQQHEAAPEAPMDEEPAAEDDEEEVYVDAADSAADSSAAGTAAAKPRRPHRKKDPLPNLPAEFAVGRESLGPLQHTEGGRAKAGEKQDVVVPHGHVCEADGEDSDVGPTNKNSKLLPDGSKPYRIDKRLTVKAHQRAENFAREHKFISKDGTPPPALLPRPPRLASPHLEPQTAQSPHACDRPPFPTCAHTRPAPTGKPEMTALTNAAHKGLLVSIAMLWRLAAGYEEVIAKKDTEIRNLKKRLPRKKAALGATAVDEDETADAVDETPAAKPGPGRKVKYDTADAKREREARQRRRVRKCVFDLICAVAGLSGGTAGFTLFFVTMLKDTLCTRKKKRIFLGRQVVDVILDDPDLHKMFARNLDKRRRPPISRFAAAHFTGVPIGAMDKMRFASIWTPGHRTYYKFMQEWEKTLDTCWCPSGPKHSTGTTQSAFQQSAQAADAAMHAADAPDEVEDEIDEEQRQAEADAAMDAMDDDDGEESCEKAMRGLEEQGLRLLKEEFPFESDAKLFDRWAGGADEGGVFTGCNVVHLMLVRDGVLLGFAKCLITAAEVFVDELLIGRDGRRQGLASHLFNLIATTFKPQRLRLQVREDNENAIKCYKSNGFSLWKMRKSGPFQGVGPESGYLMFEGSKASVRNASAKITEDKPLHPDISRWTSAAFEIPGVQLDHVGVRSEPDATEEPEVRATVGDEERPAEDREADEEMEAAGAAAAFGHDDELEHEADVSDDVAKSHGCKSLVDAITCMVIGAQRPRHPDATARLCSRISHA